MLVVLFDVEMLFSVDVVQFVFTVARVGRTGSSQMAELVSSLDGSRSTFY